MSKGIQVNGVSPDERAATYVYTLSADSGYRANETGRISANRHGLVCRALAGKLDDYDQLSEQRAELLEALQLYTSVVGNTGYALSRDSAAELYEKGIAAIALATQRKEPGA